MELESLIGPDAMQPYGRQAALLDRELDVSQLGGSVKLGSVLYHGPVTPLRKLPLNTSDLPMRDTKTPFAISAYGSRETPRDLLAAGLELKKQLKVRGPMRLISPSKGLAVSAAELLHNHVLEDGFELLVVVANGEMVVARTSGVQDINWYSKRDYDRPTRSAKVGMLPPKLAQILVNSTQSVVVADPFCGTGVVLQEALLLGREAVGSDLAPEMVAASRENLPWLQEQVADPLPSWRVDEADARKVRLPASVAVVSEGYLGPNKVSAPEPKQLAAMKLELGQLYRETLSSWATQLPPDAEIALCVPAWRIGKAWSYLGLVDELADLGYTLKGFKHVRTPLLYARDDQVVGRQLLLLRKS
jgi:tRNA G10  N-methylase Trm11